MFPLGRWHARADHKWRLTIPSPLARSFNNYVILQEDEGCCIHILKPPNDIKEVGDPTSSFLIELQETAKGSKRVTIPPVLRESTSFHFGQNVMLAGQGQYLEIWPWPHRKIGKKRKQVGKKGKQKGR